jgi:hypothetical protein
MGLRAFSSRMDIPIPVICCSPSARSSLRRSRTTSALVSILPADLLRSRVGATSNYAQRPDAARRLYDFPANATIEAAQ